MTETAPVGDIQQALRQAEQQLAQHIWPRQEEIQYHTFQRVLEAFNRHRVGEEHFSSVTGYGHDDMGRDVTDKVFANALQAESALVRVQMVSGTHALAVALNGCLRHGDTMLCLTGKPYDTLEEVIGLRGDNPHSLKGRGVHYEELSLLDESRPELTLTPQEEALVKKARMAYIQRSRGYSLRRSLTVAEIEILCRQVKRLNPDIIVMVDNCYGEFTEAQEPTAVGADLMAGSLIKNPGGGIAPAGGYIAGRADLVAACADALTCPGIGAKGGYTFELTRTLLQGLFLAPTVVKEALKGMQLAAWLFSQQGYEVTPSWEAVRSDIIQVIHLKTPENLIEFCRVVQGVSPISSHITPVPAVVPGYGDAVIMAGGTFIDGSSIELSADAPLREPYTVFFQGGLTYAHTRYAVQRILEAIRPGGPA